MTIYAGLDVSDKATHICVVDAEGVVVRRDVVASDPEVLAKWLRRHCPSLARVVLETGGAFDFPVSRAGRTQCTGDLHLHAPCQKSAVGAD
ncbi:MAG: hypothetical protein PHE36_05015 [Novosphingobium sp.]|nr:hypothetical protein [Novosphingobium sp.]